MRNLKCSSLTLELLEAKRLLAGDTQCVESQFDATAGDDSHDAAECQLELTARLRGDVGARGEAQLEIEWDDDGLEISIEVEIEGAAPGTIHDVILDGTVISQLQIGATGQGRLRLSSKREPSNDHPLPEGLSNAGLGSVLEVGSIARGTFGGEAESKEDANLGDADGESNVHYRSVLSGAGPEHGEAEFETEDDDNGLELELEVEVERGTPGSVHDVAVDGVVVGQLTVGADGRGRIRMSSQQDEPGDLPIPENFPSNVGADSVVTVGTILTGTLVEAAVDEGDSSDEEDQVDGQSLHYRSLLSGAGPEHGEAEFETEDDDNGPELELEVEVERGTPGSVHDVAVDGVVVGQLTLGADGRGRIRMSSQQDEPGDLPIPENFPSNVGANSVVTVGTILTGTLSLDGDFNNDRAVNGHDVDMLFAAIRTGSDDTRYDLDRDKSIDHVDVTRLVEQVIGTTFGDANMDGMFNSSDLVKVFQAGQYEDSRDGNSVWETGDWNGDGEFDSSDLVLAFQLGGYTADA